MRDRSPLRLVLTAAAGLAVAPVHAQSPWTLVESTLRYRVSHPFHDTEGVSHDARGKAVCASGTCDVLVAVPVKSFDSGDSNRDLHMIQAVRGAQFPLASVRLRVPESAEGSPEIRCDLTVEFAGQTAEYRQVAFHVATEGKRLRISGTIPATLSDFKIPPPSLLAVAVKNEMPIQVDTVWAASPPH
ncbi:MAG TPA: YceI family protein [Thermoanaerobaculia bacterium]|nr:YceI family protein [Thermoanaerobaculia bacterium]